MKKSHVCSNLLDLPYAWPRQVGLKRLLFELKEQIFAWFETFSVFFLFIYSAKYI